MSQSPRNQGPMRSVWSAGRYPSMAPNLLPAIARLINVAGVSPGDRMLDVGCGTGNAGLTARRVGASVVGVDISPRMLDLARENAVLAGYDDLEWCIGDAEYLPFPDDSFDVVCSNFGHVFAPDAAQATREMVRVVVPGGRVAFTAWTPTGIVGRLTDIITDRLPDHAGDPWAHLQWGDPDHVREQMGDVADLSFQHRTLRFRYVSPAHFWREFAEESGPLSPVLQRLDDDTARANLRTDAIAVLEEWFGDNAIHVEYLQVNAVAQ